MTSDCLTTRNFLIGRRSPALLHAMGQGRPAPNSAQELAFEHSTCFLSWTRQQMESIGAVIEPVLEGSIEGIHCRAVPDAMTQNGTLLLATASTKIEERHLADLAFSWKCANSAGLPVNSAEIWHVNNDYIHGTSDQADLATKVDVTDGVGILKDQVSDDIRRMVSLTHEHHKPALPELLRLDRDEMAFLYPGLSGPDGALTIPRFPLKKAAELVLSTGGIVEDAMLTPQQKDLMDFNRSGLSWKVSDHDAVRGFLHHELKYPVATLDFETFAEPVPSIPGTRPYQQIAFAAAITRMDHPGDPGRTSSIVADPATRDPSRTVAQWVLGNLPAVGSVIVFNRTFENSVLRDFSGLTGNPAFDRIRERLVDMMPLFTKNAVMLAGRSRSLKSVTAALTGTSPYKSLAIPDGSSATLRYLQWRREGGATPDQIADMAAYVQTDTATTAPIIQELTQAVSRKAPLVPAAPVFRHPAIPSYRSAGGK